MDRLVRAKIGGGPYRIVPGDVLELTMPAILQKVTVEGLGRTEQVTPYVCRVNESGTVGLPVVGDVEASGKTLAEIEADVIGAYYPAYATTRPSVFVRVLEYETAKVSVTGAVQKPGIYSLRSDQMSLVALLMEAGGIIEDGAARISIVHQDETAVRQMKSVRKTLQPPPEARTTMPIDVRLSFKQKDPSSTVGELAITDTQDQVLVREHLDVTREVERLALLEKLAARAPLVSTVEVSEKLCSLAEQLRPGSGRDRRRIGLTMSSDATATVRLAATEVMTTPTSGEPDPAARRSLYEQMSETGKESYRILRGQDSPDSAPKAATGLSKEPESLVLPVKGFNIPFADVVLQDGDSVIVERLQPPLFTVMGLVTRPGNFPYPPDVRYNLAQALAFAGGLNEVADPRYATIYRLDPDGGIVSVVFPIIDGSKLTEAANTLIKPGDIVAVEHTPRTRTAVFLDRIFRINIGTYWTMNDMWD
jgi:protein involved in polysaccharide export with SLBB domain